MRDPIEALEVAIRAHEVGADAYQCLLYQRMSLRSDLRNLRGRSRGLRGTEVLMTLKPERPI